MSIFFRKDQSSFQSHIRTKHLQELEDANKKLQDYEKKLAASIEESRKLKEEIANIQIQRDFEITRIQSVSDSNLAEKNRLQTKIITMSSSVNIVTSMLQEFKISIDQISGENDMSSMIPSGSKRNHDQISKDKDSSQQASHVASSSKDTSTKKQSSSSTHSKTSSSKLSKNSKDSTKSSSKKP